MKPVRYEPLPLRARRQNKKQRAFSLLSTCSLSHVEPHRFVVCTAAALTDINSINQDAMQLTKKQRARERFALTCPMSNWIRFN